MILPEFRINTGPNDFRPIEQSQLMRFEGELMLSANIITGSRQRVISLCVMFELTST